MAHVTCTSFNGGKYYYLSECQERTSNKPQRHIQSHNDFLGSLLPPSHPVHPTITTECGIPVMCPPYSSPTSFHSRRLYIPRQVMTTPGDTNTRKVEQGNSFRCDIWIISKSFCFNMNSIFEYAPYLGAGGDPSCTSIMAIGYQGGRGLFRGTRKAWRNSLHTSPWISLVLSFYTKSNYPLSCLHRQPSQLRLQVSYDPMDFLVQRSWPWLEASFKYIYPIHTGTSV